MASELQKYNSKSKLPEWAMQVEEFKRFLTRGKTNVTTEMLFLCFAYNINKLHNKTVKKRRKTHLFEKMIA